MGKGQFDSLAYMSIKPGSPHPMTVMKVLMGSRNNALGVIDSDKVRRYSWQFCSKFVTKELKHR